MREMREMQMIRREIQRNLLPLLGGQDLRRARSLLFPFDHE